MSKKKRMQNELEAKQTGTNELNDEDMGNVSGGYIQKNGDAWDIVDFNGEVKDTISSKFFAQVGSYIYGSDPSEISDNELDKIKNRKYIKLNLKKER